MIYSISTYKANLQSQKRDIEKKLNQLNEIERETNPLTAKVSELKSKFPSWSLSFFCEILELITDGEDQNFLVEVKALVDEFYQQKIDSFKNRKSRQATSSVDCPYKKGDRLKDESTGKVFTVNFIKGAGRGFRLIDEDGESHTGSKVTELSEADEKDSTSIDAGNQPQESTSRSSKSTAPKGEWAEVSGLHDEENSEENWEECQAAAEEETGHSVHVRQLESGKYDAVFLKAEEGKYAQSWLLELEEPTSDKHHLYLLASTFMGEMLEGVIPDLVIYEDRTSGETTEAVGAADEPTGDIEETPEVGTTVAADETPEVGTTAAADETPEADSTAAADEPTGDIEETTEADSSAAVNDSEETPAMPDTDSLDFSNFGEIVEIKDISGQFFVVGKNKEDFFAVIPWTHKLSIEECLNLKKTWIWRKPADMLNTGKTAEEMSDTEAHQSEEMSDTDSSAAANEPTSDIEETTDADSTAAADAPFKVGDVVTGQHPMDFQTFKVKKVEKKGNYWRVFKNDTDFIYANELILASEKPTLAEARARQNAASKDWFIQVQVPKQITTLLELHQLTQFDKLSGGEEQGYFEMDVRGPQHIRAGFIFFYQPNFLDLPYWEGTSAVENKEKTYSDTLELGWMNNRWKLGISTDNNFPVPFIQELRHLLVDSGIDIEPDSEQSEVMSDTDPEQSEAMSDTDSEQSEVMSDTDSEQSEVQPEVSETSNDGNDGNDRDTVLREFYVNHVDGMIDELNSSNCESWCPNYFKFLPGDLTSMSPEGMLLTLLIFSDIQDGIIGRVGINPDSSTYCFDSGTIEHLSLMTSGKNGLEATLQGMGYSPTEGKILQDVVPEPSEVPDGIIPGEGIKLGSKILPHDSLLNGSISNSSYSKKEWLEFCELVGISVKKSDKIRDLKRKLADFYREACVAFSEQRDKVIAA